VGFPFWSPARAARSPQASALFPVNVLAAIVAGPDHRGVQRAHAAWRVRSSRAVAVTTAAAWALVLVPAGPRPMWVLVVFMVVWPSADRRRS